MIKTTLRVFGILIGLCFLYILANSYCGWYAYKKWVPRRSTYGNIEEAVERNVYVKKLNYKSTKLPKDFNIYIEKGFHYGLHGANDTKLVQNSNYPYQISYVNRSKDDDMSYYIVNQTDFDSLDLTTVYLKSADFKDTLILGIHEFNYEIKKWDSIGIIKIWQ
ncbi:MAG: hypothetical protein ACK4IZ_10640 [Flavobacterium sp.]|uniref:hypothetical protein n=1 Tax=Flavobacterium sp. TaxID=239 RepID=UPI00391DB2D3